MTAEMEPRAASVSRDTIFELLSNSRRRFVIHYLRHAENPVQLTDLAGELAAWENDTTVDELTSQQRKRVYVSLYQTHVEKMNDAGVIDYDSEAGHIELTPLASDLFKFLDLGDDALYDEHVEVVEQHHPAPAPAETEPDDLEDRVSFWPAYYVGVSTLSGAIYLTIALGVGPFAGVTESFAGLVISAVLIGSGIVHYVTANRESAGESNGRPQSAR